MKQPTSFLVRACHLLLLLALGIGIFGVVMPAGDAKPWCPVGNDPNEEGCGPSEPDPPRGGGGGGGGRGGGGGGGGGGGCSPVACAAGACTDNCGNACAPPVCGDGVACPSELKGQPYYCCNDASVCGNKLNDGTAQGCFCDPAKCPVAGRP